MSVRHAVLVLDGSDPEVGRIDLPFHSFLRVVFLDEDGQPKRDGGRVGVAIAETTFEGEVNTNGHFDVLVPPGIVYVYALSPKGSEESLFADATREDLGIVHIRAHGSAA